MKKFSQAHLIALTIMIPLIGAGVMYILIYAFSLDKDSVTSYIFYSISLTLLGLLVPYLMVKAGFHAAHNYDHREKELRLKDIPKDQEQLSERPQ